ncbi:CRP-like cAMP-binding protein [Pedobacter sp. UYP30]|uniref:Crp/Fnr family transcriptional regulator n=1 Tax=Pedobacter sp. UYP30 TaxID=1756400 RepID=UPI00339B4507
MDLLFKSIRRYIPLSETDEAIIKSLFRKQKLEKGQHLLEAGKVCKNIIFIGLGLVRYYTIIDGEEKTTYFNREGEFVCDYASFLPQTPSQINIQALETCLLYTITHANIQLFYERVKHGQKFGRLALEEVYINLINQVRSLYNDPPGIRYQLFLSKFPDIWQRVPQYYIASYVGIKPQSLSRIRKRIKIKY